MTLPLWRLRAHQILEEEGWCQGDYADAHGRRCVAGAVFAAFDLNPERDVWTDEVLDALQALAEELAAGATIETDGCDVITEWNDNPARARGEVLQLLRGEL